MSAVRPAGRSRGPGWKRGRAPQAPVSTLLRPLARQRSHLVHCSWRGGGRWQAADGGRRAGPGAAGRVLTPAGATRAIRSRSKGSAPSSLQQNGAGDVSRNAGGRLAKQGPGPATGLA